KDAERVEHLVGGEGEDQHREEAGGARADAAADRSGMSRRVGRLKSGGHLNSGGVGSSVFRSFNPESEQKRRLRLPAVNPLPMTRGVFPAGLAARRERLQRETFATSRPSKGA